MKKSRLSIRGRRMGGTIASRYTPICQNGKCLPGVDKWNQFGIYADAGVQGLALSDNFRRKGYTHSGTLNAAIEQVIPSDAWIADTTTRAANTRADCDNTLILQER